MTTQHVTVDFGNANKPVPVVGQMIAALDDQGRYVRAPVIEVGTTIHTRSNGGSNYVYVEVDMDRADYDC